MFNFAFLDQLLAPMLAQQAVRFTEWSIPESPLEWGLLIAILLLVITWAISLYRRDARELAMGWRILLPTLRLLAIAGLLVVYFNPRTRTQSWAERPSRVAVLVDVSSSMQNPARDAAEDEPVDSVIPSRREEVVKLLQDQPWLNDLRERHEVAIYTFDKTLSTRLATLPRFETAEGDESAEVEELPDWDELLQPTGDETRLAEATADLMREMTGRTLAGIVVVSDGGSNAGPDMQAANDLARQLNVRLLALGTGGTKPPINVEVAKLVAPTDVQLGDPFDLEAYVRGEGLSGRTLTVELLRRQAGESASPTVIAEQDVQLLEDRTPVQLSFPLTPTEKGEFEYTVRVRGNGLGREVKTDDNERVVSINAFERPVKVLVFAGGPSWDYRFLTGVLKRHPGFEVDAVLQTAGVSVSQDVDNVLPAFPGEKADLYQYDVVICFDPDWQKVLEDSRQLFETWVSQEGGGAVFVAGDIHTPLLAAARDELPNILYLHPVFLDTILPGIDMVSASTQVREIDLTPDGLSTPLLQVTEDPTSSERFWEEFEGFYRFYPTTGAKTGASVYALAGGAGDLTETEAPILLASQFYGQGRTFYIGSPEFYRLRAEDPEYFERFWTRLSREAARNRLRRSNPRGTLLVDQDVIRLGDSIKVRARLLDADFEAYEADQVDIEVERPDGRLVSPSPQLRADSSESGRYLGEVRANLPGRYQVRMRIPGTEDVIRESVVAEVPDLENRDLRQDVRGLQRLTAETGGGYWELAEAEQTLARLPDSSEQFLLGEQIQTLWDRSWVLCVIVGLFGCEWLIRKLLKLA
ncbi:VWA domain-containing protein [Rubinisphaera brasiliensis]|uniref:VWFA domain-containing protein n=1 Tax=Rubinisphaera brasiliensis (strain ATCC 49424 / DSM 5305 / JCM 21570 / IAM 15109 / NBRC 103401 / IFAM 1448) TaxID=756272 RepID=F0SQA0_RUBBR|nr:VWA domain-containing protein [Rubinisphaera brasiliensis]ADY62279.1 hypothetical protein Plabr_4708 [Rubinisphaera brasiliensis DSM 5305]